MRLWTCGFELNSTAASMEYTGNNGTTIQTATPRSGTYYQQATSLSSGSTKGGRQQFASAAASGPYFVRVYVRINTAFPSIEMRFIVVNGSTNPATAPKAYLTVDNGGLIRLYDEDGAIGSASSAISLATWYRFEIEFNRAGSGGAHAVRARVDGTEFAGSNTRDVSAGINQLHWGGNLGSEANTAGTYLFDDIAVNDGSGSFEYSYPGDGAYIHLLPNAAGDNAAWTNDYTAVDEATPNDATDLQGSNTLDQIIDHNLAATPAGIGSGDTIKLAAVMVRFNGVGASANASFVPRFKAAASGTVEEGTAITPTSTTWRSQDPAGTLQTSKLTLYDMPGPIGTYITKADLDVSQVGARVSTGNTNNAQISAIWLGVEYSVVARPTVNLKDKFMQVMD